jgi:glucose-1-phosphate adenylyltransferase
MDYGPMIAFHNDNKADITVGVVQVPLAAATGFGVMTVDENDRVVRFDEKPDNPQAMPGNPEMALASMGIYVFNREFLIDTLEADATDRESSHDFGKNIIPGSIENCRVFAYPFNDVVTKAQYYWRDVGTVDAFFEANLELVHVNPELNLYDSDWPIWTYQEQAPPAKFVFVNEEQMGTAVNSMISGGCIVSGALINQSLLFSDVRVEVGSRLRQTVVLPHARIGRDCRITRAIIDEHCEIPDGTIIGEDHEADRKRYQVTEQGVVLVCPHML